MNSFLVKSLRIARGAGKDLFIPKATLVAMGIKAIVVTVVGIAFIWFSVQWGRNEASEQSSLVHATATVEAVRPNPKFQDQGFLDRLLGIETEYLVSATYHLENGKRIGPLELACPARVGAGFSAGDVVPIVHRPNLPTGFWFEGDDRASGLGRFIGWAGVVFLGLGFIMLALVVVGWRKLAEHAGNASS